MTDNQSFIRKVVYIVAMALLLIPLYLIGSPSRMKEGELAGGGYLAKQRSEHGLAQVTLGEIDPAGETMKLATLGMRGPAANILWSRANYYKKTEQFDKMNATVKQITRLQPNFISVWEFHGHNMSYNTSVEFDDYRLRYHWVKKGIGFLIEGTQYNRDNPRLLRSIGHYVEQKIGRSDEKKQFRRMFRVDEDFHELLNQYVNLDKALGPDGVSPDCWLVGRLWKLKAQRTVDNEGVPIQGISPLLFHSAPSMSLMYYAAAIENEGYFGQKAQAAWEKASDSWQRYGDREITTPYGFRIKLNDLDVLEEKATRLKNELAELTPGIREQLEQEKRDELSAEALEALDTDTSKRTPEQRSLAYDAEARTTVSENEIARAAPPETRDKARRIVSELQRTERDATLVRRYREIVNFEYWRIRAEAEKSLTAVQARQKLYEAERLFDESRLVEAKEKYEEAWKLWREIFDKYPLLLKEFTAEDLVEPIERYRDLLDQLDLDFPDPFILQDLLNLYGRSERSAGAAKKKPDAEQDPDKDEDKEAAKSIVPRHSVS